MKTAVIIIPCSANSKRLPNKPLLAETGKPLLLHTFEAAKSSELAWLVSAATDKNCAGVAPAGCQTNDHRNGTQRVAEAVRNNQAPPGILDYPDIIVNLQVDEPLVTGEMLDALIKHMADSSSCEIATLVAPMDFSQTVTTDDYGRELYEYNRNVVKVAMEHGRCHWFSRAPLAGAMQHIGVYAYRSQTLLELAELPESALGKAESLEQLDWLVAGYQIDAVEVDHAPLSINTREDYEEFKRLVASS